MSTPDRETLSPGLFVPTVSSTEPWASRSGDGESTSERLASIWAGPSAVARTCRVKVCLLVSRATTPLASSQGPTCLGALRGEPSVMSWKVSGTRTVSRACATWTWERRLTRRATVSPLAGSLSSFTSTATQLDGVSDLGLAGTLSVHFGSADCGTAVAVDASPLDMATAAAPITATHRANFGIISFRSSTETGAPGGTARRSTQHGRTEVECAISHHTKLCVVQPTHSVMKPPAYHRRGGEGVVGKPARGSFTGRPYTASSSANSASVSVRSAAAAGSRMVVGRDDPGIGMTTGHLANSQDRDTCCAPTPRSSAIRANAECDEPRPPAREISPGGL